MFRRALRLGSRVSVASAAAVIPATAAACLSDSERRLQERLRLQGGPSVEDYLKARDAIEPERRVIVVVGITGAGKSSTANTIRGSRAKEFEVADSLSSVTRAAAFRDFAVNTGGPGANVRRFVEDCEDRVVGVENRLEPHRTQSTRRLHQAVLECLATNDSTYKFKPSVALKRHQSLNELDVQDDDVAIADDTEQVPAKADPAENAVAVAVN